MANNVERNLMCLLAFYNTSSVKYLLMISNWIAFFFFTVEFERSLYNLDTSPWSDMCFGYVFSSSYQGLFPFLDHNLVVVKGLT